MTVRSDFPHEVEETAHLWIPLPDGTRLAARMWRGGARVPAVLEMIPYRKRDGTLPRDEMMHPYVAGHGYACVRVDLRGSGDSDGLLEDEYSAQELQDACDVIAWIAAQPWCDGRVGMMGKSWGGFNCLQTAWLQPPALKAVVSVCSTTDRFADDIHFKGGCLLGENFGWGAVMLSYQSRPPDPALRDDWRAEWLRRLEALPHLAPRWAGHQGRDGYWRHGSVGEDPSRLAVPVLAVGGWADNYMNTPAALVEGVPGARAIVGPWVHQYPHTAVPGPRIGFLQECVAWWDRWLKGREGPEVPAMRAYVQHSCPPDACATDRPGAWVALDWPLPSEPVVLDLGALRALPATVATAAHHGMHGGEFFPMGLNAEMPGDQRGEDALCLTFDTDGRQMVLIGQAVLGLTVVPDKPLGHLYARLCDVAPDGSSLRIAHGCLSLAHRDPANPEPATPGVPVEVVLRLDQMAHRLAPGHRLRLSLATACWPFLWPVADPAAVTVTAGRLTLPRVTAELPGWVPPPPQHAPPWRHEVLRPGQAGRRVEHDLIAGSRALVVRDDTGEVRNLDHGLVTGETVEERWEIRPGDPLSARAAIRWEQRLSRGAWAVRTEVCARQWGDAQHLHMTARVRAWEGEALVHDRTRDATVPRRFV